MIMSTKLLRIIHVLSRRTAFLLLAGTFPLLASAGDAGKAAVEPSPWQKPAWLTELSLGVKETYDSNIFLAGADIPQPVPPGTVGYRNVPSWFTTVSPKVGVSFLPLFDAPAWLKGLSLAYSPDFAIFPDVSSETNAIQRVATALKTQSGPVTVSIENLFTYVNGSDEGLVYPNGNSSFVNGTVRERRDQWQDRLKSWVKVDVGGGLFVRPIVSLAYYDLATEFKNLKGYTNYVDRYDLNGGADLGYGVSKNLTVLAGYRYGHQYQEQLPKWIDPNRYTATSDYQRVLAGLEGTIFPWLKVDGYAGPQFTSYTADRPTGWTKPGELIGKNPVSFYADAAVTVLPAAADTVTFRVRRWNWVSSTGRNAYLDAMYDVAWRRQLTKALQAEVGARAWQADYNPSATRDDWDYTFSAGVRYAVNEHLSVDLSYAYDLGRSDQEGGVPDGHSREFSRNVVSSGFVWKF